jgi:hypothetical protein
VVKRASKLLNEFLILFGQLPGFGMNFSGQNVVGISDDGV